MQFEAIKRSISTLSQDQLKQISWLIDKERYERINRELCNKLSDRNIRCTEIEQKSGRTLHREFSDLFGEDYRYTFFEFHFLKNPDRNFSDDELPDYVYKPKISDKYIDENGNEEESPDCIYEFKIHIHLKEMIIGEFGLEDGFVTDIRLKTSEKGYFPEHKYEETSINARFKEEWLAAFPDSEYEGFSMIYEVDMRGLRNIKKIFGKYTAPIERCLNLISDNREEIFLSDHGAGFRH
jgi:hypothetical protein